MIELIVLILLVMFAWWLLKFAVGAIVAILLWALVGWLAAKVVSGRDFGLVRNAILGLIGGVVGTLVVQAVDMNSLLNAGIIGDILVGVIGGVVVLFVMRFVRGR
jgi:uncharacterized membrane protein YeaQ/YmgE (transglycosylase-associated protein family)